MELRKQIKLEKLGTPPKYSKHRASLPNILFGSWSAAIVVNEAKAKKNMTKEANFESHYECAALDLLDNCKLQTNAADVVSSGAPFRL